MAKQILVNLCNEIYRHKKNKVLVNAKIWVNLENTMPNRVNPVYMDQYYMMPFTWSPQRSENQIQEVEISLPRAWGRERVIVQWEQGFYWGNGKVLETDGPDRFTVSLLHASESYT